MSGWVILNSESFLRGIFRYRQYNEHTLSYKCYDIPGELYQTVLTFAHTYIYIHIYVGGYTLTHISHMSSRRIGTVGIFHEAYYWQLCRKFSVISREVTKYRSFCGKGLNLPSRRYIYNHPNHYGSPVYHWQGKSIVYICLLFVDMLHITVVQYEKCDRQTLIYSLGCISVLLNSQWYTGLVCISMLLHSQWYIGLCLVNDI